VLAYRRGWRSRDTPELLAGRVSATRLASRSGLRRPLNLRQNANWDRVNLHRSTPQRQLQRLIAPALVVLLLLISRSAFAYPWMIKHGYTACATCHTDPSGAGLLTPYGRAQSSLLLSSHFGGSEEEPSPASAQLFGLVPEPDWLLLGGWVRNGYIWNGLSGRLVDHRFLQMRADAGAHFAFGHFRAQVTLGYNDRGAASQSQEAWLTRSKSSGNVVSREHWVGFQAADDRLLVRAGRINLPFGLRTLDHTAWVRSETRTDINQSQQDGAAVAFTGEAVRAEMMLIAGNYQVRPDAFRERGYSGYAEIPMSPHYTLGVSSFATHAASDVLTQRPTTRHAHGLFFRGSPIEQLVFLAEFDALGRKQAGQAGELGYVGSFGADLEPWRGLHATVMEEVLQHGYASESVHWGTWLGVAWFPYPHFDFRIDGIRRTNSDTPAESTLLVQVHLYL
jgi:hypothetical protein